jgi:sarcosine oxidase
MAGKFDVIIIGLGAMGSAAASHLAQSGQRVLGLDRFTPPHTFGSSHGQTRIIREAYFEHPVYVPMVQRAYELWVELATRSRMELFRQTGGLMIGRPDSRVVSGAKASADTHRLPHEILNAQEVRRRFPTLRPADDMMAVLEPRAGILFPERCLTAHLRLAREHGASLGCEEPVLSWEPDGDGVKVTTTKGEYRAGQLILSAGSWIHSLLPGLNLPFRVERQIQFWFDPKRSPALFQPEHCPIHLWQFDGSHLFYGFPDLGDGVKVACHHDGERSSPEEIRRDVAPEEIEAMRRIVRRFLPDADGPLRSATVCLYTNTPDEHFWIDRHPEHPQVLIASPCSGHGFKFSSVIGEILKDLICGKATGFDLSLFRHR